MSKDLLSTFDKGILRIELDVLGDVVITLASPYCGNLDIALNEADLQNLISFIHRNKGES